MKSDKCRFRITSIIIAVAIMGLMLSSSLGIMISGVAPNSPTLIGASQIPVHSMAEATYNSSWTELNWSVIDATVTKYTPGGAITYSAAPNGTGWEVVSVSPANAHRAFSIALPGTYRPYAGMAIQFDIKYLHNNPGVTTNYGQQFSWGFMRSDVWTTSKPLISSVTNGEYNINKTQVMVEQAYYGTSLGGGYSLFSWSNAGAVDADGATVPSTKSSYEPLGTNCTAVYRFDGYSGTTMQNRNYFGVQVLNLTDGPESEHGDALVMNQLHNNVATRNDDWKIIFEWKNGLTVTSDHYYNMSISPIKISTDFGRANAPYPFQQDAPWQNHTLGAGAYTYHDPYSTVGYTADPSIIWTPDGYYMAYHIVNGAVINLQLANATSLSVPDWAFVRNFSYPGGSPIKPDLLYLQNGTYALFFMNPGISVSWSEDLVSWATPTQVIPSSYGNHTSINAPSILRDVITGTPFKIGGKYWMAYSGGNSSGANRYFGYIGMAYSPDLITWTDTSEAIYSPDINEPSTWQTWYAGSPNLFAWNGSVYILINAGIGKPTLLTCEPSYFGQTLMKATNINNFVGNDMLNWTLIPEPLWLQSNVPAAYDGNMFYTGDLKLQVNGVVDYYYNARSTSYTNERITHTSINGISLPTEVTHTARLGYNRLVPSGQIVAQDWSGSTTGISITSTGWMDVDVSQWSPGSSDTIAQWSANGTSDVTFTLSGLDSGRMYKVYIDGVRWQTLTASGGSISFTYSGPWSEHQFEVVETSIGGSISGIVNIIFIMLAVGIVVGVTGETVNSFRKKAIPDDEMTKRLLNMVLYIIIGLALLGAAYATIS